MEAPDVCIGIDLGTTFSCVGIFEPHNGTVTIIPNKRGSRTTPSWVAYTETERLVGADARNQAVRNPKNTLFDAKRLIGRKFSDACVQNDLKHWPFVVEDSENGNPVFRVQFRGESIVVTPEEVSAAILSEMRHTAEDYLGHPVRKAVITVPAYFNDAQRSSTKNAGAIAGLEVLRVVNEPTAAAIAYELDAKQQDQSPANILIFDLGGGTLDVTVLESEGTVLEVKSTCGDTHLGGEDFDQRLLQHFVAEFREQHGADIADNPKALRKLGANCTEVKHALSQGLSATLEADALHEGIDFSATITRAKFEELCEDLFKRCLQPVATALNDAAIEKQNIHDIVLVGGSTRIPAIQDMLRDFFDGKALSKRINPDEAVAFGAAILGAKLSAVQQEVPEKLQELTLIDVTAMSLGIEVAGGRMSVLIPRNTSVPYSFEKTFLNHEANATEIVIDIYEGESSRTKDNRLLGTFSLGGVPARPRGQVRVDVRFGLDANGILEVSAAVQDANVSTKLVIESNKGLLRQEDIEKFKLAEQLLEKRKKTIDALLQLEQSAAKAKKAHPEKKDELDALSLWIRDTRKLTTLPDDIDQQIADRRTLLLEPLDEREKPAVVIWG